MAEVCPMASALLAVAGAGLKSKIRNALALGRRAAGLGTVSEEGGVNGMHFRCWPLSSQWRLNMEALETNSRLPGLRSPLKRGCRTSSTISLFNYS